MYVDRIVVTKLDAVGELLARGEKCAQAAP